MGNSAEPEQNPDSPPTTEGAEDTGDFWGSISTMWDGVDFSGVSLGLESGVDFITQSLDQFANQLEDLVSGPAPASYQGGPIVWGGMLPHPVASKKLYRYGNENYRVGLATMHGWRPTMEDAHCVELVLKNHPHTAFFGIFDGHGGSRASLYVAEHIIEKLEALEDIFDQEQLVNVCVEVDRELLATFSATDANVGSTCIFSIIRKEGDKIKALFGNIGDSRIVWAKKKGTGYKTVGVTEDHHPTLPLEQERIEKAGGKVYMNRVDGMLAVSRAFGDIWFKVPTEAPPAEKKVSVVPEFQVRELSPDDVILMACDGIYEADIFSRESVIDWIAQKMNGFQDVSVICGLLLNECLARGSRDNMSSMLITFKDGEEFAKKPEDYIPGPWFEAQYENDWGTLKFQQVYEEDAKAAGYTLDQAVKLRAQMERQRTQLMAQQKQQQ